MEVSQKLILCRFLQRKLFNLKHNFGKIHFNLSVFHLLLLLLFD
jgi:hypothetical protein